MEVAYQIIFYKDALKDIDYWKRSGNKQALTKIDKIIEALEQNPHSPTPGEPENVKICIRLFPKNKQKRQNYLRYKRSDKGSNNFPYAWTLRR